MKSFIVEEFVQVGKRIAFDIRVGGDERIKVGDTVNGIAIKEIVLYGKSVPDIGPGMTCRVFAEEKL